MNTTRPPGARLAAGDGDLRRVQLTGGNPMLVLAALVCGLFQGWRYLRLKAPLLNALAPEGRALERSAGRRFPALWLDAVCWE